MVARLALAASLSCTSSPEQNKTWTLVWQDEFNGPVLDATKWAHDTGGGGWGNAELEYYTDRSVNARVENGSLRIDALHETFGNRNYTSARLKTEGLAAWRYGRIEPASASRVDRGSGLPSGCSATIVRRSAGLRAARWTSWKTSARSRAGGTVPCTARGIPAHRESAARMA